MINYTLMCIVSCQKRYMARLFLIPFICPVTGGCLFKTELIVSSWYNLCIIVIIPY
jgi:hypothetical protein